MATYRSVVYNIQDILQKNFDDTDINRNQILFWVLIIANRLMIQRQQLTKTGLYNATFAPVTVNIDTNHFDRKYIDLPEQIMDLPNEEGVEYITYNVETGCCCDGPNFAQQFFQPTTPSNAQRLYGDEYEKPDSTNPYFYRITNVDGIGVNRIYFLGTECIDITDVEICLKITLNPNTVCNLDENIPLPDDMIGQLQNEVLQLGRFALLIPQERDNDGADSTTEKKPRIPAIPEMVQPQEQQQPEQ